MAYVCIATMLKSLYPRINWSLIEYVGFDLDGTLYDEFEFIAQAYRPVAERIAHHTGQTFSSVYESMTKRWLEMGSSYPHIFYEALQTARTSPESAKAIIRDCVADFRACQPTLALAERTRALLDIFSDRYRLFMVTDGNCALQRRKISALGLERWFSPTQLAISGCQENESGKPSTLMVDCLCCAGALRERRDTVVFFGDRDVDRDFAANAGFSFVRVHQMHPFPDINLPSETQ